MNDIVSIVPPTDSSPTGGIQEALDRLPSGGGTVQLAPAEYRISQTIRLPNRTTLFGCRGATRLSLGNGVGKPGHETHVITNLDKEGGHQISVKDLCVDGNYSKQIWTFSDIGGAGIAFDGVDDVLISGVSVQNTWRHGIWFCNGKGARIFDCDVHTVGCSNISLGGQHHFRRFTEEVQIRNCRLSDSRKEMGRRAGNCGIEIKDHTRCVLVADCFSYGHQGIGFAVLVHAGRHPEQRVDHVAFSNCKTWQCLHGFAIGSAGDFPVKDIAVTGCESFENSKSGLCIHASHGGQTTSVGVTGCSFHDNLEHGIILEGDGLKGILLSANRIYENGQVGLSGSAFDPRTIEETGNILWNNETGSR